MYFFNKLIGPRPTFPMDITPEEGEVMKAHAAYWREWMDQGKVVVYGPVMDPNGVFGCGVVVVESEAELLEMLAADPVVRAGLGRYEHWPMMAVVPQR